MPKLTEEQNKTLHELEEKMKSLYSSTIPSDYPGISKDENGCYWYDPEKKEESTETPSIDGVLEEMKTVLVHAESIKVYKQNVKTRHPKKQPIKHRGPKWGRNEPCLCGSGKKYKKCCLRLKGKTPD